MSLRKMLRRAQRKEQRHGVMVTPAQENGLLPAHKMEISQETLDLLVQGHNTLVQRRQQLLQQLQALDAEIQAQVGGIRLMQSLLANQEDEAPQDTEPQG